MLSFNIKLDIRWLKSRTIGISLKAQLGRLGRHSDYNFDFNTRPWFNPGNHFTSPHHSAIFRLALHDHGFQRLGTSIGYGNKHAMLAARTEIHSIMAYVDYSQAIASKVILPLKYRAPKGILVRLQSIRVNFLTRVNQVLRTLKAIRNGERTHISLIRSESSSLTPIQCASTHFRIESILLDPENILVMHDIRCRTRGAKHFNSAILVVTTQLSVTTEEKSIFV